MQIHYTSRSLEGCVIETSQNREPLQFVAGSDEVIRGVSEGVLGMIVGEARTLTVSPEMGFGRPRQELVRTASRSMLPSGVAAGDQLAVFVNDARLDVWIQRIVDDDVTCDANHPLAGETLVVDLHLVGIES